MKPICKWSGGKRNEIKYFEKYIPTFEMYVEPFVGGGAVYWHLEPSFAHLNDINWFLIHFYQELKNNYEELVNRLQNMVNTKEAYYQVINILNKHIKGEARYSDNALSAIFYYLNKTAFSGMWRVNSQGLYNTSYGEYKNDNFKKIEEKYSRQLQNTILTCGDYRDILETYRNDKYSFVFLDPPYLDSDTMYTANQEFHDIYQYLKEYMETSETKCMLIVKSGEFINNLFKDMIVDRYTKNYRLNAKSDNRHDHLVITNY